MYKRRPRASKHENKMQEAREVQGAAIYWNTPKELEE